jgi:hypothetical protein
MEAFHWMEGNADENEMDEISALPLSLSGEPKWNSHSCRRGGTKRARDLMDQGGEDYTDDINRHFGWAVEAAKGGKKRQMAYAATLAASRRIRVTKAF